MEYIFSNLSAQGTLGFHGAPLGESALPYLLSILLLQDEFSVINTVAVKFGIECATC